MATNLISAQTPPGSYAVLSPASSSYDFNRLDKAYDVIPKDVLDKTTLTMTTTTTTTMLSNATMSTMSSTSASMGDDWTQSGINGTDVDPMSNTQTVLVSMVLAFIVAVTITGNFLVVISIIINAHLRTTTNYFIANLAFADLLLGTTVLPFSASLEVLQYWAFGQIFCNVWAAIDVLCCTASILSLCVISIDRYIGVTRPLQHPAIVGHRRALYVIFGVWILSGITSVAPLIGWKEEPDPNPLVCTVTTHTGYVLFSTSLSFYIPCLILLLVYYRIYRKTVAYTKCIAAGGKLAKVDEENKVVLRIHTGNHRTSLAPATVTTTTTATSTSTRTTNVKTTTKVVHKSISNPLKSSSTKNRNGLLHTSSLKRNGSNGNAVGKRAVNADAEKGINHEFSCPSNALRDSSDKDGRWRKNRPSVGGGSRITFSSKVARFKREKKAAKTLGIVVGVFITCWFPFFFLLPLQSLCTSCEVPPLLFKLIFWLGYCNSTMNPIIYTCSSTEFRRAFQNILLCRRCRRRRHNPAITTKVKLKVTGPERSSSSKSVGGKHSKTTSSGNSFEFGNFSTGSSKFPSSSVVSTPCFHHRQVYEMSGYQNGNGTHSPLNNTSSDLPNNPSRFLCDDCKTIWKSNPHRHSDSSVAACPLSGLNETSTRNNVRNQNQNHTSLQNSMNPHCTCCNNVLEDIGLSMSCQEKHQGRERLPSSCEISMASLSCHSSSPTMSSSGPTH